MDMLGPLPDGKHGPEDNEEHEPDNLWFRQLLETRFLHLLVAHD